MRRISDERLEAFKQLYLEVFGKKIEGEEAFEMASRVLLLMELIYKPMTEAERVRALEGIQGVIGTIE